MLDTGQNLPETVETLMVQRLRLMNGKRHVQMFPAGTPELPLPAGMHRVVNARGVFHFNPGFITAQSILQLSAKHRENEFLELGPYNKQDVIDRIGRGENLVVVTEYTPDGVEVRSAAGTDGTLDAQLAYFEKTKELMNTVVVGSYPPRVQVGMKGISYDR